MTAPLLNVQNERRTVRKITAHGCSIARFGDGEIKLMMGRDCKGQPYHPTLRERLMEVAKANVPRLLVGVPRIYENIPPHKLNFWRRYATPARTQWFDPEKQYYSAFITRPDHFPELDAPYYWDECERMWKGRRVMLIKGHSPDRGPRDFGMLFKAKSVDRFGCPQSDAWPSFDELRMVAATFARTYDEEALIVLCCGPTATVLAHDLCLAGHQALDLGHLPNFWKDAKNREPSE